MKWRYHQEITWVATIGAYVQLSHVHSEMAQSKESMVKINSSPPLSLTSAYRLSHCSASCPRPYLLTVSTLVHATPSMLVARRREHHSRG
jgi:hypothetical protein